MRNGPTRPAARVAGLGLPRRGAGAVGRLAEADREFAEAIRILAEQRDDNASLDLLHGMLRLHARDVAGYHRIRRETLESFREWQNPAPLKDVTWLAVIGPPDPEDDGTMIVLAERWNRLAPGPAGPDASRCRLPPRPAPGGPPALRAAVQRADPE